MQTIDFNSLETPLVATDGTTIKSHGVLYFLGVGFGGFLLATILAILSPWLILPAFGAWFYALWKMFSDTAKESTGAMERFKTTNGWSSGEVMPLDPGLPDLNYRFEPAMVNGQLDGHRFWLYLAVPQSNSSNAQPITLLSVETTRSLPRLLLFPAIGVLAPLIAGMARNNFGLSPLRLEGNFNDHVQVYHQEGEQIDTLSYLTPDVMAVVEDTVKDIVLYNDKTFSVSTSAPVMGNPQLIRRLFVAAQVLIKEIDEKA